jgi:hypothetical protein
VRHPDSGVEIDASDASDASDALDARADVGMGKPDAAVKCTVNEAFGSVEPMMFGNGAGIWHSITLRRDGLEGYVDGGDVPTHIYRATRASTAVDFDTPEPVIDEDGGAALRGFDPALSPDGLSLYYVVKSSGSGDGGDIYVSTRSSVDASFHAGTRVPGDVNSPGIDADPFVSADGKTLYFDSDREGNMDIYSVGIGIFNTPAAVSSVNLASAIDVSPVVTDDNLTIYFGSSRSRHAPMDMWMASRVSTVDGFGEATLVPPSPDSVYDYPQFVSADGCTLWFSITASGGSSVYFEERARLPSRR